METDSPVVLPQMTDKRIRHVKGMIRSRKTAFSPFLLRGTAVFLQELCHRAAVKAIHGTVEKLRIPKNIGEKLFRFTGIGVIASSLSRDIDLLPGLFVVLQNGDLRSAVRCGAGCHKSCSPCTDYNNFLFLCHISP